MSAPLRVAVVTPFYQTTPGLLTKALRSVFTQDLPPEVEVSVHVVDDASPSPAAPELEPFAPEERERIHLEVQENAGPGAARNTALDQLDPEQVDFVAFLDSDDEWRPQHLARALEALGKGFDFYFCDHTRFNSDTSYFLEAGRQSQAWRETRPEFVTEIDPDGPVLHVAHPHIFEAFLTEYLSQTSTVVYRFGKAASHRFNPEQRKAGEDFLFWLGLLRAELQCVVDYRPEVHCGEGINLYASAYDFSSPKVVERVGYILLCNLKIKDDYWDYAQNKAFIQEQITRYTRAYGYLFTRSLLMGQKPNLDLFRRIWRKAPGRALAVPWNFFAVLPTRAKEAELW